MSEQIQLFSEAISHKEKALGALGRFALAEAREHLDIAREIDPYLADLGSLSQAADFLLGLGIHSKTKPSALVRAWEEVQRSAGALPGPVCSLMESMLCRRIVELLPAEFCDFVDPKKKTLHVGACYLLLDRPAEAHKKLLDYVSSHLQEPHPTLWGYFGDAAFLLNRREEANGGYLRALIMDPQAVDLKRIRHPELRQLHKNLRAEHDEDSARSLLPIHACLDGVLHVPRGNTWLARFIRKTRFDHSEELLLFAAQRWHQFALCMYIDRSGLHGEIDFDARTEMKRLDAELFGKYLEAVARVAERGKENLRR